MSRTEQSMPPVAIGVASWNTAAATELCIRTMRETAGMPFTLTVGDGGSTDGSLEMLRGLAERGWLELDVQTERRHADWLDQWRKRPHDGYLVFSDSDMEFRRHGWLVEMVSAAQATGAALLYTEMETELAFSYDPHIDELARRGPRPVPWLMLLDVRQVKDIDVSLDRAQFTRPDLPEGKLVYDVGGLFMKAVQDRGLPTVGMPKRFGRSYRHYGGISWAYQDSDYGRQKDRERRLIERRLSYVTMRQEGERRGAAIEQVRTEFGASAYVAARKLAKVRRPSYVLRRLRVGLAPRDS